MKPTEKEEDFIEKLLSEYSWDEGKRIYYQKVAVIVLQAIRKAKKEVFDDLGKLLTDFITIKDDKKKRFLWITKFAYNDVKKRHLSTLQKSKAT